MPKPPPPSSNAEQPPLIGRIVHALVIATGVAGAGWFGWTIGNSSITKSALALLGGALFAFLWLGVYAPDDPERRWFYLLALPGRALLILEVALIVAGGVALWLSWHRAAGETYWTVAIIELAIRYPRVAALWNGEASSSDRAR